ncbi:TraC family protein [Escherichia coli]
MSFPQFSRLLPYRDYNQESGLFMNDTTLGFMLEAIPINGANESIVEALDHMLRTKLPRGIPLCIHLMSSQLVGDRIEYGLREFSWSGEQADRFNAALEASLQTWQQKHHAVILVSPAVVQGTPDITREIQQDIARRMRAEP